MYPWAVLEGGGGGGGHDEGNGRRWAVPPRGGCGPSCPASAPPSGPGADPQKPTQRLRKLRKRKKEKKRKKKAVSRRPLTIKVVPRLYLYCLIVYNRNVRKKLQQPGRWALGHFFLGMAVPRTIFPRYHCPPGQRFLGKNVREDIFA